MTGRRVAPRAKRPLCVLIADDDPVFRRVISFTLRYHGIETETVMDGPTAWEVLQSGRIDMLVMDYQMPPWSAEKLLDSVRSDRAFRQLPVVLCTARGLEFDTERFQNQYHLLSTLHKPFSPRKLTDIILNASRTQQSHQPAFL